jgi:hypothetical protein
LIHGDIFAQNDFGATDSVFLTNDSGDFGIHTLCLLYCLLVTNAARFLLDKLDVWWLVNVEQVVRWLVARCIKSSVSTHLLIDTNAKGEEFMFDNLLMRHRLCRVQNNEYQVAGPSCGNDLSTSTPTISGTFNDPWQVPDRQETEET